jgi:transposase
VKRIPKQEYTAEFKEQAVKRAQEVGVGVAARELGLVAQTLRNWVKASSAGQLSAPGAKPVVAVGTEIALRPPHRSVRAALPHTAPALSHDAKRSLGYGWRTRTSGR